MIEALYDEEVDDDLPLDYLEALAHATAEDDGVELPPLPTTLELRQVRAMVLKVRQLEREAEQLSATAKAVLQAYQDRGSTISAQHGALRDALRDILERGPFGGKVQFPDVGARINLSTAGGNLVLDSQEAAVAEYGFRFTEEVVNHTKMNQWAREHHKETGQVPTGYRVEPKRKTLVVAKL